MKKLTVVITLLLLGVVGWAGATYYIGGQVQMAQINLFDKLSTTGPFAVTAQDYQRGFLGANFRTQLEMPLPGAQQANSNQAEPRTLRLTFESEVQHGPLLTGATPGLALIRTRLVGISPWDEELQQIFAEVPQLKEALSVTHIDFSGTLQETFTIPAINTRIEDAEIIWGGMQLESHYAANFSHIVADFAIGALDIRGEDGDFNWGGMEGQFDLNEALPRVYVGTSAVISQPLAMTVTAVQGDGPKSIRLEQIKAEANSSCDGKLVEIRETLDFGGIEFDGQHYGPGSCDILLKNLDGKVLGRLQQEAQQLVSQAGLADPQQQGEALLTLYGEFLGQLLQQKPEIHLRKLHFATPQGDVDASLQVKFSEVPQDSPALSAALFQGIDANAQLALHETLVRQIIAGVVRPQLEAARAAGSFPASFDDAALEEMVETQASRQIEAVLAQSLIRRDGDRLRSQASLQQGALTVNGQTLPLFQ